MPLWRFQTFLLPKGRPSGLCLGSSCCVVFGELSPGRREVVKGRGSSCDFLSCLRAACGSVLQNAAAAALRSYPSPRTGAGRAPFRRHSRRGLRPRTVFLFSVRSLRWWLYTYIKHNIDHFNHFIFLEMFCFSGPQRAACGILVSQPGIEPRPSSEMRVGSPNH